MKIIEMCEEVLRNYKKPMHVDDLALAIAQKYPNLQISLENLPSKISNILANDIKRNKSKSIFAKPKNKQGGFKRGVYRIKSMRNSISKTFVVPEQPKVPTAYTGHAGEFAVLSELLFFGYNATIMTVDDGIDVIASKDNKYFQIQVKTANLLGTGKYNFGIHLRAFDAKDASTTFYILVMRVFTQQKYINEYIILPNAELRRLIERAIVTKSDKLSLRVEQDRNGKLILNDGEDISWCKNRFDLIK